MFYAKEEGAGCSYRKKVTTYITIIYSNHLRLYSMHGEQ